MQANQYNLNNPRPVSLILDTDMGNDIDDALALAMIHSLQSRGECRLLGVSVNKDNPYAPVCVDIINTFYGRGDIPIGMVQDGATKDDGAYARDLAELGGDGTPRYARTYQPHAYPDSVKALRQMMAGEPDRSIVVVMIGFSTNMDRLLKSNADELSDLSGKDLFAKKVKQVIMMAANFHKDTKANPTPETREYNIIKDIPSAQRFIRDCPTPIVFSGLEVGKALMFPGSTIEHRYDWIEHHPISDSYRFFKPMPYDRPSWDLTSVLVAVRPDGRYFGLSEPGQVTVEDDGIVRFTEKTDGPHHHLTLIDSEHDRIIRDMVDLVTMPIDGGKIHITTKSSADMLKHIPRPQSRVGRSVTASPDKAH